MGLLLNDNQRAQRKMLITYVEWYEYTLTTEAPDDWSSAYDDYYRKVGGSYVPVTDSEAPTWAANTFYEAEKQREKCGVRVADSSIEFNNEINKTKDVTGKVWNDIDNVEPQQSFDSFPVIGGSRFGLYLSRSALIGNPDAYNGVFVVYVIAAYDDYEVANSFFATKDVDCTVEVSRLGGSNYTDMDYTVYYSQDKAVGTVDKLTSDFVFTEKTN